MMGRVEENKKFVMRIKTRSSLGFHDIGQLVPSNIILKLRRKLETL